MKTNIFITTLTLLLIAAFTTCKKEPDAPSGGNKIEFGQTTADSVAWYVAKVSTEIISTGGNTITQHGHCWSIESNPNTDDAKTTLGKLEVPKTYTSELTGLKNNTTYYIRSYVTYPYGTIYGIEKSIKTLQPRKPKVITAEITNITRTSAKCCGTNDDGGLTLNARGVCWNTTGNPTLGNSTGHTIDGTETGSFISTLTALNENTHYYVTAYATNEKGTDYGKTKIFKTLENSCKGETTITYHGQTYNIISIGDQCWMKENLNYETGNSWCYKNAHTNCDIYGRLYDWTTIMNGASSSNDVPSGVQGICPNGWHIPSDAEWDILVNFLGGSDVAGGKMKEAGTTHWNPPNTGATNESGFTALPGGYRSPDGDFYNLGGYSRWWSTTEYNSSTAWRRSLDYHNNDVGLSNGNKYYGFNIRCIKDQQLRDCFEIIIKIC